MPLMVSNPRFRRIQWSLVFFLPLLAGIAARILFFKSWFHSPFRYYHVVQGLDMKTLLGWGDDFSKGQTPFSLYSIFIASVKFFSGGDMLPEAVVMAQMMLGLACVLLTVYTAKKLFGRKLPALASGLFMAVYSPMVIYETQILKATLFTFLCLSSLAFAIFAKQKRFRPGYAVALGFIALLPALVRISGISCFFMLLAWAALCLRRKSCAGGAVRGIARPLGFILLGATVVVLSVVALNLRNSQPLFQTFSANLRYILSTGAKADADISPKPETTQEPQTAQQTFSHFLSKLLWIFGPREMPNNINYYFVSEKLPASQFLPGPGTLIPLALTGLILIILKGGITRKESILFFHIAACAMPMMLFLPLSRYKLALIPVFAVAAGYAIQRLCNIATRRATTMESAAVPSLLLVLLCASYASEPFIIRSSDLKAYALAATYYPDKLMSRGYFSEAADMLDDYYVANPRDEIITLHYASAMMGLGKFKEAEMLLVLMGIPEHETLYQRYFYELGECNRLQGNEETAMKYYKIVCDLPGGLPGLRELSRKHLSTAGEK